MESGRLLLVLNHSEGLRLTGTVYCNTSRWKDIAHENGSSTEVCCSNGAAGHAQISFASSASLGMKWENVSVAIARSSSVSDGRSMSPALQLTLAGGSATDVKFIQWSVLDVPTCVALNNLGIPLGPVSPVAVRHTTPTAVHIKADDDVLNAWSTDAFCPGELLLNGICLPEAWPPVINRTHHPPLPPYLEAPPAVIDISVGRQLFVDSFLISPTDSSNITISYHNPVYRDDVNPVVFPSEHWEGDFASAYSGGLWWDPSDTLYKMWYRCGGGLQCLATSPDGVSFNKPIYDVVAGTNIVLNETIDGSTVWLDLDEPDPAARFKMAAVFAKNRFGCYTILHSGDGVHWQTKLNCSGTIADRSTIFLNPMRRPRQWVYSIKICLPTDVPEPFGRSRAYWETPVLGEGANWTVSGSGEKATIGYAWTNADVFDPP